MARLSLSEARALIEAALMANGVPEGPARSVATALVAAEAEGQAGHGFSRLEDYVLQVRSGKIRAGAEVGVRHWSTTGIQVDAGYGFAFPALDVAILTGTETALAHGSATIAVTRSHHCGALSVQVEKLARAGLIGIMVANAPAAIAPSGARTPLFGTNPIAFAAPREDADPLVIDLSVSRVARGKVMHAKKSGTQIPEGWALDAHGQPTTDPGAALAGSMLPIGGPKGTALALMVEVLAAVATGGRLSAEASSFFSADGPPPGVGQFLLAFQVDPTVDFASRLETLLSAIVAMEGARLPGSRRAEALHLAETEGIEVPDGYVDKARTLAQSKP